MRNLEADNWYNNEQIVAGTRVLKAAVWKLIINIKTKIYIYNILNTELHKPL